MTHPPIKLTFQNKDVGVFIFKFSLKKVNQSEQVKAYKMSRYNKGQSQAQLNLLNFFVRKYEANI
jgi:hypothetical protein